MNEHPGPGLCGGAPPDLLRHEFRHAVRLCVVVWFLLAGAPDRAVGGAPEHGRLIPESFTSDDFGGTRRCSGIAQDQAGVLYVGNTDAVLTYDGATWRSVRAPIGLAQALRRDEQDRIWVAGIDDFGWLEADERGDRQYHSLQATLAEGQWNLGGPLGLEVCSHGVYVMTDRGLLRFHDGEVTILEGRRYLTEAAGDMILAQNPGGPLEGFDGQQWRVLIDVPEIRRNRVTSMVQQVDGSWLVCTAAEGLWRWTGETLAPFPTDLDEDLRGGPGDHRLSRLQDDTLAVRLGTGGLGLLGTDGRLLQRVMTDGQARPLARARGLVQDAAGGIWLPSADGLCRIEWRETYSTFDHTNGMAYASIKKVLRMNGRVYAATLHGLQVLEAGTGEARFAEVPGGNMLTWHIGQVGEQLVMGGAGLRILTPGTAQPPVSLSMDGFGLRVLPLAGRDDLVVIGTAEGLRLLRRTGSDWALERWLPQFLAACDELVAGSDGDLWVGEANGGYTRIAGVLTEVPVDVEPEITRYRAIEGQTMRGLPAIAAAGGKVWVAQGLTLYEFDRPSQQFVARCRMPGEPDGADVKIVGLNGSSSGLVVRTSVTGSSIGITGRYYFWPIGAEEPVVLPQAAAASTVDSEETWVEETPTGPILWIGGNGRLVRAPLATAQLGPRSFRTLIRRVADDRGRSLDLDPTYPPQLDADHASLRFRWSTDRLDDRRMRYQTWLEGRDADWSAPGLGASYEVTALAPGDYVMRARATDQDGREGTEAAFPFTVMPPWWLRWWSWAGYAMGLAGGVVGFVRWRGRALLRRNEELERQVDLRTVELREREQQILEARDAAEAANRAKSVFLASMSHELRTPLNAILGYGQLLRDRLGGDADVRRQLGTIQESGEHLLQMINEVLDLAKVEANRVELQVAPMALNRLMANLQETFALRAGEQGLSFAVRSETPLPDRVMADENRLRQVLYNLLGNAIKFTSQGGVELRVARVGERLQFAVIDSGPGVPAEHRERIFDLFQQGLTPGTKGQGTGLGLAISQRLVRLMGGEIKVEAGEGGHGSRFVFSIKLVSASRPPWHQGTVTRLPRGYHGPRCAIWVVDDEAPNRQLLVDLLEPRGFSVRLFEDGAALWPREEGGVPDLILLDLQLRTMSGYEVARRLRQETGFAQLPIVAVSASVYPDDRDAALVAGCDEFLSKPVDAVQLFQLLGQLLELTWQTETVPETSLDLVRTTHPPEEWVVPAEDQLRELDQLVKSGDIVALRQRLAALLAQEEASRNFLTALAAMAADARLAALRTWVAEGLRRRRDDRALS